MIRRLAVCFFLVLLSGSVIAASDRASFIRFAHSLVKVEAVDSQGHFYLGTGVTVAPGTVVTNCHVTRHAHSIRLIKGGERFVVQSEWSDLEHDVCLLYSPVLDSAPIAIGTAEGLKLGQKVAAMGYTGGLELQVREGKVEGLHRLDGGNVIQTSTAFTSGASGGALFDDQGRLVGILTFHLRGTNGYYFSTPVDWFLANLNDRSRYEKVIPLAGPSPFWERPFDSLPYFMQASSLAADSKWLDIVRLTDKWSGDDVQSAEPWVARGNAYANIYRSDAAIKAYRKAVTLEPRNSIAWFSLGRLYLRKGENDNVRDVREILGKLDEYLFQQLLAEDSINAKH